MKKNIILILKITLSAVMCVTLLSGCGDKKTKLKYGDKKGVVSGSVTFSEEGANIKLDNVIADLNSDIDYTSGIEVEGDGEYTMDVNASNVKYDTPGTYIATYTLKSGDNTYTENVKVTISKNEGEKEAYTENAGQASGGNGQSFENGNNSGESGGEVGNPGGNQPAGEGGQSSAGNQPAEGSQPTGGSSNGADNGNSSSATQPTNPKELITEKGGVTYKNVSIGNSSIELLSGNVVTIKCSTNNYIVETKTVESEVTKSGHKYKVTKLVVVFNTGKEQTVETIEKRID